MPKWTLAAVIFFLLITTVYLYNFQTRILFGPEQALSLIVSSEQRHSFTLLGLPNLQRVTSNGHILYSGSLFNYTLIPLLIFFKNDPVPMTVFFALILLGTGGLLYHLVTKMKNQRVAFFALVLFLINATIIWHGTFIWILNYLPLVGLLTMYLLHRFHEEQKKQSGFLVSGWLPLCIGVLSGIGFNLQYMYVFTGVLVALLMIAMAKQKIQTLLLFIAGAAVGNLPMVIFDARHDWYHLRTLIQYAIDTYNFPGQNKIAYYHFLQFWPVLAYGGGVLLDKLWKIQKVGVVAALVGYAVFNFRSSVVDFSHPVGMPEGLLYQDYLTAGKIIADDEPKNFNVTSTLAKDTNRTYPLRYVLIYLYGYIPENQEAYQNVDAIYAFHQWEPPLTVTTDSSWELAAFGGRKVELLGIVHDRYGVYKVVR